MTAATGDTQLAGATQVLDERQAAEAATGQGIYTAETRRVSTSELPPALQPPAAKMMKCSNCNAPQPEGRQICGQCGGTLNGNPHKLLPLGNAKAAKRPRSRALLVILSLLLIAVLAGGAALAAIGDSQQRATNAEATAVAVAATATQAADLAATAAAAPTPMPQTIFVPGPTTVVEVQVPGPTQIVEVTSTAIPDNRLQLASDGDMWPVYPQEGDALQVNASDRFSAHYRLMAANGDAYVYISTDSAGSGWVNAQLMPVGLDITTLSELARVEGVLESNIASGRSFFIRDGSTLGAWLYADGTYSSRVQLPGTQESVAISNGDFIVLNRIEGTTAYIRINTNKIDGEAARGQDGAIPLWLLTNRDVPAPVANDDSLTQGGSNVGGAQAKVYRAYRYNYTPSVSDENTGHSRISYRLAFPNGFDRYDTSAVTVVIGGASGDSLDMKSVGRTVDVANGNYTVKLMQYKDGGLALISEINVTVSNGHTVTVTFTGGETVVR